MFEQEQTHGKVNESNINWNHIYSHIIKEPHKHASHLTPITSWVSFYQTSFAFGIFLCIYIIMHYLLLHCSVIWKLTYTSTYFFCPLATYISVSATIFPVQKVTTASDVSLFLIKFSKWLEVFHCLYSSLILHLPSSCHFFRLETPRIPISLLRITWNIISSKINGTTVKLDQEILLRGNHYSEKLPEAHPDHLPGW